MAGRKEKTFPLAVVAGLLLVLGLFACENDGNFLWFVPGIVAYIVNLIYYLKKPARIVWEEDGEEKENKP